MSKAKKVIFVIVEGPTDKDALSSVLKQIFSCTVKDVQNGINSLRNIKYIKSKLIVDGPAITNALNWHIWSNNYNLINFIYSASSINKYEKEYNSALRDLKLYAPKVLRHSEIGFKTKLSILLRTFFPITFIKRDNKKAKLAYEKDTME